MTVFVLVCGDVREGDNLGECHIGSVLLIPSSLLDG